MRDRGNTFRKRMLKLLAVMAAAVLVTAAGAAEGLREDADNFFANPDPKYEKLITRVEKMSHSNSYHGALLLATDDGIILFGGPKAVTRDGLPVDLHTTYNIGSCSKTFTAVAVFQLIEAGKISLDDSLRRFFPEYQTGEGITVRHLLHMQSGIPDYVNEPISFWGDVGHDEPDSIMRRLFRDEITDEEILESLYKAPLHFEPGTQQSYSNTNYYLLALITEQISGMRLCDYFQAHIFDSCGMEHTTSMVVGNETSVPTLFSNLRSAGVVDENGYTMQPNSERGAGGVHICLADFLAFDRALLSLQLIGRESFEEMTRFDMNYGCGLYPYKKNSFGHSGRDGSYTTQNVVVESAEYGRVYFIASTPTDAGVYGLNVILEYVTSLRGEN